MLALFFFALSVWTLVCLINKAVFNGKGLHCPVCWLTAWLLKD
jgi:hypothetical protein